MPHRNPAHAWLSSRSPLLCFSAKISFSAYLNCDICPIRSVSPHPPLDERVIYEILASPQWATQASLLPHDPSIMAMSRQSASPCPETAPPSLASLEDLNLFQDNLLSPAQQAAQPKTGNRKLETENRLFNPRDKGGKLPGKSSLLEDNNNNYQQVKLYEKIGGSLGLLQPTQLATLETRNPKLETLFFGNLPGNKPLSEIIYEQSLRDKQCEKIVGKALQPNQQEYDLDASAPLVET